MYRHAPEAIAAFPRAEIVGHGRSNSERQGDLTEDKERLLIEETTAAIEKHSGHAADRLARAMDFAVSADARSVARGRLSLPARLVP